MTGILCTNSQGTNSIICVLAVCAFLFCPQRTRFLVRGENESSLGVVNGQNIDFVVYAKSQVYVASCRLDLCVAETRRCRWMIAPDLNVGWHSHKASIDEEA